MLAVFLTCYLISEAETAAPGGPPTLWKWVTPCRSAAEEDASVRLFQTAIRNPAHLSSRVVITHMGRIAGNDKEGLFSPSADSQSVFFLNDSRAEECFPFDRRQSAFCGREVTVTESRQQGASGPTLGQQGRCYIDKVPFGFSWSRRFSFRLRRQRLLPLPACTSTFHHERSEFSEHISSGSSGTRSVRGDWSRSRLLKIHHQHPRIPIGREIPSSVPPLFVPHQQNTFL